MLPLFAFLTGGPNGDEARVGERARLRPRSVPVSSDSPTGDELRPRVTADINEWRDTADFDVTGLDVRLTRRRLWGLPVGVFNECVPIVVKMGVIFQHK